MKRSIVAVLFCLLGSVAIASVAQAETIEVTPFRLISLAENVLTNLLSSMHQTRSPLYQLEAIALI